MVAKQAYLSQIGRFWFPSGLGTSGSKTSLSESDRSFLVSQRLGTSGSKTSLSESDRSFLVSQRFGAQVVAKQAYLSQIGRFWFPSGLGHKW